MRRYCCIFSIDEKEFKQHKEFEKIKNYGEIISPNECKRKLLKCKKCGELFLYQFLEWNIGDRDLYYEDFIQVQDEEEANQLNTILTWEKFNSNINPMIKIGSDNIVHYKLPKNNKNMEVKDMKEKFIRLIIFYVLSVYEENKKNKESCHEVANLLLLMIKNEENKADRLLNSFPEEHPVTLIYSELKENSKEDLIEALESAIESINKYNFEENILVKLEDDLEVEKLSKKISEI